MGLLRPEPPTHLQSWQRRSAPKACRFVQQKTGGLTRGKKRRPLLSECCSHLLNLGKNVAGVTKSLQ